jgi:hypothetical protein
MREVLVGVPPAVPQSMFASQLPAYELSPALRAANRRRILSSSFYGGASSAATTQFELLLAEYYRAECKKLDKIDPRKMHLSPVAMQYVLCRRLHSTCMASPTLRCCRILRHLLKLEIALHAEELQMESDIRAYDLFYAELQPLYQDKTKQRDKHMFKDKQHKLAATELVYLEVPGVGERRPALNLRDSCVCHFFHHFSLLLALSYYSPQSHVFVAGFSCALRIAPNPSKSNAMFTKCESKRSCSRSLCTVHHFPVLSTP